MFPLKDRAPTKRFPFVNLLFICFNIAIFIYEIKMGPMLNDFVTKNAIIPYKIIHPNILNIIDIKKIIFPFIISMFLHGGWIHLIGNIWYLWIFGDNIEDRLGHFKYFLFYFFCGLIASLIHIIFNPNSQIPCIGASGAIAGVLGAYLIMLPKTKIVTIIPIFMFLKIVELPAFLILFLWFAIQFLNGTTTIVASNTSGIAHWAHIGGFLTGLFVISILHEK